MKSLLDLQIVLTSIAVLLNPVAAQGVASVTGLNPGDIPLATRGSWCQSQTKTCGQLCNGSGQQVGEDTCDYNVLSSLCKCDDDSFPDTSQFSFSLASLACNWQLSSCLTNATSTSARNSCRYQYICGGRNPLDGPGAVSTSTSSTSTASNARVATSPTNTPSIDPSSITNTPAESTDSQMKSYGWVAAPVVGILAVLAAIILGLWWHKRRQKRRAVDKAETSSTEDLWGKAELDSTPVQIAELHGVPKAFQMAGGRHESRSELPGSPGYPVELDASNEIPAELSPSTTRLVRTNAYRSPYSPTLSSSPYAYEGEISPATSTISEIVRK